MYLFATVIPILDKTATVTANSSKMALLWKIYLQIASFVRGNAEQTERPARPVFAECLIILW